MDKTVPQNMKGLFKTKETTQPEVRHARGGCSLADTVALMLATPATCRPGGLGGGGRPGSPGAWAGSAAPWPSGPRQPRSLSGSDFSCIKQARQNESPHAVVRESMRWTESSSTREVPRKNSLRRDAPGSYARACARECVACACVCVRVHVCARASLF